MRNVFLWTTQKAESLNDEELAEEIRKYKSGEKKFFYENGGRVPLHALILPILQYHQNKRAAAKAKAAAAGAS
jgi:hypothetical protein